jgi:hypothetical protein
MKNYKLIQNINLFYKLASETDDYPIVLSDLEKSQLGQSRPGSEFPYISPDKWDSFRQYMLDRSKKSNKKLDETLTAYTPGETVNLLNNPKIKDWFAKIRNFKIPDRYKIIILVPCAKTKPWGLTRPKKSDLYNAYHRILEMQNNGELQLSGQIYFVTISEPLGVVPQDFWDDFPQYDNPGLFKDPVMRSGGLFTKDYPNTPLGKKEIIPFDEAAYNTAINLLATEIGSFIDNNKMPGRIFVSFVDDSSGKIKTTHSDMLDRANIDQVLPHENRFPKPAGKTSTTEKTKPADHYLKYLDRFRSKI